ncbi:diol dehydratase reactivase subunit alpha, partial [Anaerobutyricum soehngenii]|uniref:hypothetical protein n=1 Tax=Anaerobutyricum soehngenii TaxID=105843 RepID=UPI002ECFF3F1|nr:diol dehydratase reactivase subunit alpha [Anaerobutyricum soehngenii]
DLTSLASSIRPRTGLNGTLQRITGACMSLMHAIERAGREYRALAAIRINTAALLSEEAAKETLSEPVIT